MYHQDQDADQKDRVSHRFKNFSHSSFFTHFVVGCYMMSPFSWIKIVSEMEGRGKRRESLNSSRISLKMRWKLETSVDWARILNWKCEGRRSLKRIQEDVFILSLLPSSFLLPDVEWWNGWNEPILNSASFGETRESSTNNSNNSSSWIQTVIMTVNGLLFSLSLIWNTSSGKHESTDNQHDVMWYDIPNTTHIKERERMEIKGNTHTSKLLDVWMKNQEEMMFIMAVVTAREKTLRVKT